MQIRNKKQILYSTWAHMKQRCNGTSDNKNDLKNYYDRKISYDPFWESFENFYNDMHKSWKKNLTLDRIDNNNNYSKNNCHWIDRKGQAINRRNTRLFSVGDKKHTLTDWATILGIKRSTLAQRFYVYKWSIARTFGA